MAARALGKVVAQEATEGAVLKVGSSVTGIDDEEGGVVLHSKIIDRQTPRTGGGCQGVCFATHLRCAIYMQRGPRRSGLGATVLLCYNGAGQPSQSSPSGWFPSSSALGLTLPSASFFLCAL